MNIWTRLLAVGTAFCLLTSFIAVGHGVAPFAYLIVGTFVSWINGDSGPIYEFAILFYLVMAAVATLLLSAILPKRSATITVHVGIALGLAGFATALCLSDPAITTFIFSCHFLAAVVGLVLLLHPRILKYFM